jgi:predicted alpha/beta-hydrolase family hydrolase
VEEVRVVTQAGPVSASVHGAGDRVVILGHGAGSTRRYPALVELAEDIAASGRAALLYNFPYTETGRRRPDQPDVLEATVVSVAEHARAHLGARRLVLGGRSMGGRIASQAVAKGLPADGLVFLAYPLHPPGKRDQLRDRHLPAIQVPMLFVQGTRDDFATPELLDAVVARLGDRATLHRVEGGDHSFGVRKSSGRTVADVKNEVRAAVLDWLGGRGL